MKLNYTVTWAVFLLGLISVFKPFARAIPLESICCVFSGAVQVNDG